MFLEESEGIVQVSGLKGPLSHVGRFNRAKLQGRLCDDPGQSRPAHRGPEQFRGLAGAAPHCLPIGGQKFDLPDEVRDSPVPVVVRAVKVEGDRPPRLAAGPCPGRTTACGLAGP
jgi:hypothetical protein